MRILYIGGTGEISYACLGASAALGHELSVFNRGRNDEPLPAGTRRIVGDLTDPAAYGALRKERFDVVCQFKAYDKAQVQRDLEVFGGACGQYVFISSASAYLKPPRDYLITEATPLVNPYWAYSQAKADAEAMLMELHRDKKLPVTIVRPSHTYRRNFPGTYVDGDTQAWRMLHNRPVIVHGDGTSLWTATHAEDFAVPFVRLLGNARALGEAYHLTGDNAYAWDQIIQAIGRAIGAEPDIVHVPTRTVLRYKPAWTGSMLGDKTWSTLFDNTKIKSVVGDFICKVRLEEGMKRVAEHYHLRAAKAQPDVALHELLDRIAADQQRLGT